MLALGLHTTADFLGFTLPQALRQQSQAVPHLSALLTQVRECPFNGMNDGHSYVQLLDQERFCAAMRDSVRDRLSTTYQDVLTPSLHEYGVIAEFVPNPTLRVAQVAASNRRTEVRPMLSCLAMAA